ncbi:hypothetical protein LB507_008745 [Fusarium sp. FIESC RH6]|nr:hypothetical protein LB507_008745 [Fusarium sp. FIESC RH6]
MEVRRHDGMEVFTDSAAHAPEVYHHKEPMMNYTQVVEVRKGPCGLSIWSLCTLVAVITAVIVGAGVGGGLGAALASCKSSSSSNSVLSPVAEASSCPTPTSSSSQTTGTSTIEDTSTSDFYEPTAPDQVANLTLPSACSSKNGQGSHTTLNGYVFSYTCGFDFPGPANDIAPLIAYTAWDCMHACAMYTELHKDDADVKACDSIAFVQDMSTAMRQHGANCWLKTGTRKLFPEADRLPRFLYAKIDS